MLRLATFLAATLAVSAVTAAEMTPFQMCAWAAITRLDDFISSADVVAAAAVESCRDRLQQSTKDRGPEFVEDVMRGLTQRAIPKVLEIRAAAKLANKVWNEETRKPLPPDSVLGPAVTGQTQLALSSSASVNRRCRS